MKDLTSVYVTVDIWTNRQMHSFIGFTAHFVDNDFDLKSHLLCCEHFTERHTTVNTASRYENVVMTYPIDGKVRRIISDNASLMKKAIEFSFTDMKVFILFYFYFYFYLYIYPPDSQESDGGAIHRVSNYPDLLPEMPSYCCPLVI